MTIPVLALVAFAAVSIGAAVALVVFVIVWGAGID